MTCGIYKLDFLNTDKVYIGQSVNIEKRYSQHLTNLKNNSANYKLLEAYTKYGLPTYTTLTECNIEELDELESECINIWNSVENGFNIYYTSSDAPTYSGFGYGNSKYSREQILKVFNLLVDTDNSLFDISEITEVNYSTVCKIHALDSHMWLNQEFPEKYTILKNKKSGRSQLKYNVVSDKLSAKAKGIIYPKIQSPLGQIFFIENAYKFAKQNGLAPNHFQEVLNGRRKSHKGWKLCPEEQV